MRNAAGQNSKMTDYTKLPIGEKAPHRVDAVIKILKDLVNKLALAET